VPSCDYYFSRGVLTLHLVFRAAPDGTGEVDISASEAGVAAPNPSTYPMTWTPTSVTWSIEGVPFHGTLDLAAGTITGSAGGAIQDETLEMSWEVHRG
jgi:hypothetical protein